MTDIFALHLQYSDMEKLPENELPLPVKVARGAAYALWSLAKSKKNKVYIQKAGGLTLLVKLVRTKIISVIIPAIGTLQVRLLLCKGCVIFRCNVPTFKTSEFQATNYFQIFVILSQDMATCIATN